MTDKLLVTFQYLKPFVCKKSSGSSKNVIYKMFMKHIFYISIEDLTLNNLQWLICYKTQNKPFKNEITYKLCAKK